MERHINAAGLEILKSSEGWSSIPYQDPVGIWTIGWGHVIREGENFTEITSEEGERILKDDCLSAEYDVDRFVNVPLSDNQFSALVSFVFNLGGGALERSTLLEKLNSGDYRGASEEFPRWVYAGGKKLGGLIKRRKAEQELFNAN